MTTDHRPARHRLNITDHVHVNPDTRINSELHHLEEEDHHYGTLTLAGSEVRLILFFQSAEDLRRLVDSATELLNALPASATDDSNLEPAVK